MLFQPCMGLFLQLNTNDDVFKNVGNQTVVNQTVTSIVFFLHMEVNRVINCLLPTFFKIYSFIFN